MRVLKDKRVMLGLALLMIIISIVFLVRQRRMSAPSPVPVPAPAPEEPKADPKVQVLPPSEPLPVPSNGMDDSMNESVENYSCH